MSDKYKEALRQIILLDNDAHLGLSTWRDMRVQAHKKAEHLLGIGGRLRAVEEARNELSDIINTYQGTGITDLNLYNKLDNVLTLFDEAIAVMREES